MGLPFIVREMSFGNFLKRSTADSLHRKDHTAPTGRSTGPLKIKGQNKMIHHDPT
jgi:hypothetical protein